MTRPTPSQIAPPASPCAVASPAAATKVASVTLGGARNQVDSEESCAFRARARVRARPDVVGVFGYSDEDKTEPMAYDGRLDEGEIDDPVDQRAEDRIGETVEVLIEDTATATGRAAHQGPEVDGNLVLAGPAGESACQVDALARARVVDTDGADPIAEGLSP